MIDDPRGPIDYDETGQGPTVVLVPGSCSTGAAWRPMMSHWKDASVKRANELLGRSIPGATVATIPGAAHFMIATHASELAGLIASHLGHAM